MKRPSHGQRIILRARTPFQQQLRKLGFVRDFADRDCQIYITYDDEHRMTLTVQLWTDGQHRISRSVEYKYMDAEGETRVGMSEYETPVSFETVEQMLEAIPFVKVFPLAKRGRIGAKSEEEAQKMNREFQKKFEQCCATCTRLPGHTGQHYHD